MKGRIPQNFIDELLARADIVDVINSRVPLKKKGREYSACCPFHNEKTPSFTVSEAKQFYHCFGCGAHGTAISFLMEYENMDFVEAVEQLAADYQMEVPRESGGRPPAAEDDREPLYAIMQAASELYREQLKQSDKAVQYLKDRGLVGEIARDYQLGYAPDDWQFLVDRLGTTDEQLRRLKAAGLVIENDKGKQYDRFRDRVMFPIHDRRGRCIGFGGRIIGAGEPKYLNSPETILFHKGSGLYGFYEARKAVRNLERLIVVEGYMDVVALAQSGIPNAVATLGTATTLEQVQQLFRSVQEIIFCYDGDNAGRKAAWRALEQCLPVMKDGYHASFLFLPEGEDPDSLVREEGRDAFNQRLNNAKPLSEFLFDELSMQFRIETMDGKAALAKQARPLLAKLPDSVFAELMWSRLSELVGIEEKRLHEKAAAEEPNRTPAPARTVHQRPIQQNATRDAIALMLQYPALHEKVALPASFASAGIQGMPLLYRVHRTARENPEITPGGLLERFRDDPDLPILQKLMRRDIPGSDEMQQRTEIFRDAISRLQQRYADHRFALLEDKITRSGLASLSADERQEYQAYISGQPYDSGHASPH